MMEYIVSMEEYYWMELLWRGFLLDGASAGRISSTGWSKSWGSLQHSPASPPGSEWRCPLSSHSGSPAQKFENLVIVLHFRFHKQQNATKSP